MIEPVIIGDATLYCGDCRDILPTLPRVDVVICDPPYGIGLTKKTSDYRDSKYFDNGASLAASVLYQDDFEYVRELLRSSIPLVLSKASRALIFSGPKMLWEYPPPASVGSVFTLAGAGRTAWGFQCTHPVLFYGKDPYLQDGLGGRPNSLKDDQPNSEIIDHPCPEPLAWMKWAVERASRIGETILDPFMGSGTTGVAAVRAGRSFIGIEQEPSYFATACRRISEAYRQSDMFVERPAPARQEALL